MKSLNKVQLIGHLGKDPELRYTQAGKAVTSFSLATAEGWIDKGTGEDKTRTEWHTIVLWDKLAELAAGYMKKGSRVYVEGRIQSRDYDDKDGNKRKAFEIVGHDFLLLDSKGAPAAAAPADHQAGPSYERNRHPQAPPLAPEADGGDIPF